MNFVQLLESVKYEVTAFYNTHANAGMVYHNLQHTEMVVEAASRIASHYQLADRDFFAVMTAAWYHDTGYYIEDGTNHEQRGAGLAAAFLRTHEVDEKMISQVQACILATVIPQAPENLPEEIVCDADFYHFGTNDFADRNKLMREEAIFRSGKKISKQEWRKGTIGLMQAHRFHTEYCREQLEAAKQKHLKKLLSKQEEADAEAAAPAAAAPEVTAVPVAPVVEKKGKDKDDKPSRGIETMFRISSNNHQRLSDMADNKAHIMITTTSIIISVLLSVLLRKLEDNPHLTIPTIMLLTVCVITMVLAILATRPSLPHGTFTQQDLDDKRVNLLFFGNFYRMEFEKFSNGMKEMMNDKEFLYGSLTRDVYSQGIVLGRKYRLLRIGYSVFMFGIVASVLAFVTAVIVYGH